MGYIYRHVRKDNGETFYIGLSNSKIKGYGRSRKKFNRNYIWKSIVAETDYIIEILIDNLEEEDTKEVEELLIKLYGRINLNTGVLANLTDGGEGTKQPSEEEKDRRRPFQGNHLKRACVAFETGIEYLSLKDACKITGIKYTAEKQRVNKKSFLASFYYKGEFFEREEPIPKKVENNRSGTPVIAFDTDIEYPTLKEGCRQLGLNYDSERTAIKRKYSTAKFYRKNEYFHRRTEDEILKDTCEAIQERESKGMYREFKVIHIETGVVYPNMRVACELLGLNYKSESNRVSTKRKTAKFKRI